MNPASKQRCSHHLRPSAVRCQCPSRSWVVAICSSALRLQTRCISASAVGTSFGERCSKQSIETMVSNSSSANGRLSTFPWTNRPGNRALQRSTTISDTSTPRALHPRRTSASIKAPSPAPISRVFPKPQFAITNSAMASMLALDSPTRSARPQ